jgi:hypothetical protein
MSSSHKMSFLCAEKPYRWFAILLLLLLSQYLFNEILDAKFSLCSVRCRHAYGSTSVPSLDTSIEGNRPVFGNERCDCYQKTSSLTSIFLGSISWHETNPPPSHFRAENVCAADGREYSSQQEACNNHTYPLHQGFCGACSNEHDINVYHETKLTMSLIAYQCMVKYLTGTEKSAFACFKTQGLTNNCNQCWIDNMKCSASSCLWKCIWHNMINKMPWSDHNSTLNPCIRCDEELCGPAFVKCAGANRRRAGIVSDISRPGAEVWNRTVC